MAYWPNLIRVAAGFEAVEGQLGAMTAWRAALQAQQLPKAPLPPLGLTPADYLAGLVAGKPEADLRQLDHLLRNFRQYIAYHFGMWSFVNRQLLATWTDLFGPQRYLEVAAGNGYLSLGLREAGNRVITTDPLTWAAENATGRTPVVPITAAGSLSALWRYGHAVDAVVMAWSPDGDPNDAHFLRVLRREFPQLRLFIIGERNGATNSRLFWQTARFVPDRRLLALNRALPQFDAINERVYLMR